MSSLRPASVNSQKTPSRPTSTGGAVNQISNTIPVATSVPQSTPKPSSRPPSTIRAPTQIFTPTSKLATTTLGNTSQRLAIPTIGASSDLQSPTVHSLEVPTIEHLSSLALPNIAESEIPAKLLEHAHDHDDALDEDTLLSDDDDIEEIELEESGVELRGGVAINNVVTDLGSSNIVAKVSRRKSTYKYVATTALNIVWRNFVAALYLLFFAAYFDFIQS